MHLPFEALTPYKTALKRFFSTDDWVDADDEALSMLVAPHLERGWFEHDLGSGIVLGHGIRDGRYVIWATGGPAPAPTVFDRAFSGPVRPVQTPHPRKVKFAIGGAPAPGRWYRQGEEVDDEAAAALLADATRHRRDGGRRLRHRGPAPEPVLGGAPRRRARQGDRVVLGRRPIRRDDRRPDERGTGPGGDSHPHRRRPARGPPPARSRRPRTPGGTGAGARCRRPPGPPGGGGHPVRVGRSPGCRRGAADRLPRRSADGAPHRGRRRGRSGGRGVPGPVRSGAGRLGSVDPLAGGAGPGRIGSRGRAASRCCSPPSTRSSGSASKPSPRCGTSRTAERPPGRSTITGP